MHPKSTRPVTEWSRTTELLRQLVVREIAESIKGSSLGIVWLVVSPLLSMCLYVIVFGLLFGGKFGKIENETSLNYAIGIYVGLSVVSLVNETIAKSTNSLIRQGNLIRKVVFPLELLPVVQVAGTAFKLGVNAVLWLLMGAFFGSVLRPEILHLLLLFLPMLGIALGLASLISAVSVYFRDIQQLTNVMTQIVFWSSGVFYSSEKVQQIPELWIILKWNPVLLAIENVRAIVLWGLSPDFSQVAYLYIVAVILMGLGFGVFRRLKSGFADFL
ncbi:MAG: ABC transporter permease [Oceanipulchritudo sp.]|jgi:lipopolysaccharide transport system permease protein